MEAAQTILTLVPLAAAGRDPAAPAPAPGRSGLDDPAPGRSGLDDPAPGRSGLVEFLPGTTYELGRSSRCALSLEDGSQRISRVHARLEMRGGRWWIIDASRHGTLVGGARIALQQPVPLSEGDIVQIGDVQLLVRLRAPDVQVDDAGSHARTDTTVFLSSGELAHLEPDRVLAAAFQLPGVLGQASGEQELLALACDYVGGTLAPAVTRAAVVAWRPHAKGLPEVIADYSRLEGTARRQAAAARRHSSFVLSRRVLEQACSQGDDVVFLQQLEPAAAFDATVDPTTHFVGAALIESDGDGGGLVLYACGDRPFQTGEQHAGGVLRLVATLVRLQSQSLRRHALAKYFSPEVVKALMARGGQDTLSGKPRVARATSLFFDLRGFSLGVADAAIDLLPLHGDLRRVMNIVTAEVFDHQGIVIDYTGDGVFAAWGLPFDQPDQSARAVRCATTITRRLGASRFAHLRAPENRSFCGIGIAAGEVLVGRMGSDDQYHYGLLGPSVNTASRLEGLTRSDRLDAPIVASEEVHRALDPADTPTLRLGRVVPAGMNEIMSLYEVLPSDSPFVVPALAQHWERALSALESARTPADLAALRDLLPDLPAGHARTRWLEQATTRIAGALADWDGIQRFAGK